jgi:hypothetical protein
MWWEINHTLSHTHTHTCSRPSKHTHTHRDVMTEEWMKI